MNSSIKTFIKLTSVSSQICSNLCCSNQPYLVSEHITHCVDQIIVFRLCLKYVFSHILIPELVSLERL